MAKNEKKIFTYDDKSTIEEIYPILSDYILGKQYLQMPILIGKSGIGKSEHIKDIAKLTNHYLIDFRCGNKSDPADVSGVAYVDMNNGKKLNYIPCDIAPLENEDINEWISIKEPNIKNPKFDGIILFLDEITHAIPCIQNGLYSLIQDHTVNGFKLHNKIKKIAAGNPYGSEYNTEQLSLPLINKSCIFNVQEPTIKGWRNYMKHNKIEINRILDMVLVNLGDAFTEPQLHEDSKEDKENVFNIVDSYKIENFPTQRTWTNLVKATNDFLKNNNYPINCEYSDLNDTHKKRFNLLCSCFLGPSQTSLISGLNGY